MSASLHESPSPSQEQDTHSPKTKVVSHQDNLFNSTSPLTPSPSHLPHTEPIQQYSSIVEVPDEIYDRFSNNKKLSIVAILSLCSFLTPISSTTVLAAVPEVAADYHSTGTIINLSNALYLVFMGISPCFWGPLSQVYGRRIVCQFMMKMDLWGWTNDRV